MRNLVCILLVLVGLASPLWAGVEQAEEQRFAFAPGGTVRVAIFGGAISVMPSEEEAVRVVVLKSPTALRPEVARRWLEGVQVTMRPAGAELIVEARYRGPRVQFSFADQSEGTLRVELHVPRRCHLDLQTGVGRIDVGPELAGNIRAKAESGGIALGRIDGEVEARIERGSIQLSRATGRASLQAAQGGLTVGTVLGRATLETGSGDIDILDARAGLDARAVAGDVTAGFPRSFSAASSIKTSGGNIVVSLDPTADVAIEASSVWGRVSTRDLAVVARAGGPGRGRLVGSLNAGGPLLKLHANGGHVTLKGEPDLLAGF